MKKDKVPKWSKAAFQDKFNIMKGKLENAEDEREKKYSDMDANLAKLQRKLRDGSALETGERGKMSYTQYGPIKNGRIKNQGSDFEKK